MNTEFWIKRWADGKTGFHRNTVNPRLSEFKDQWLTGKAERILVPLCGKSTDMRWLADRGHQIVGVEISGVAIRQFFEEEGLAAEETEYGYRSKRIELVEKDIFDLSPQDWGNFDRIYDRAAMVAMPIEQQERYGKLLLDFLKPGGQLLLVTVDYDRQEMNGPPFTVPEQMVRHVFANTKIRRLAEDDILEQETKFKERGLSALSEAVWLIQKPL